MAFITNYNFYCIQQSYSSGLKTALLGNIYKKDIDIFSPDERNDLLLFQYLLRQSPELKKLPFINHLIKNASYHYYKNCKLLNSDYAIIKEELINGKKEKYVDDVKRNSGVIKIKFNRKEIENKIDTLIQKIEIFTNEYPQIINDLKTNLGRSTNDILKEFNKEVKKPITDELKNYYTSTINPEMHFDGSILEKMGLKLCNECYNKKLMENFNINDMFKEVF